MDEKECLRAILSFHGYELIEPVGKGGFATCWKVLSLKYQQIFVCKIIDIQEGHPNATKMESFAAEIDALIHLTHVNIIQCFGYFREANSLYLILEYCQGGSLLNVIEGNQLLARDQILFYAKHILSALQYIHEQKIAHLDIKPSNILLDKFGRIKLADFGLACSCNNGLNEMYNGSLAYMAPEIIAKTPYDPFQADVWAFGVTFYQIVNGSLPWRGHTRQEVEQYIRHGIYSLPPKIDQTVATIIRQSLVVNPQKRATIDNLLSHIENSKSSMKFMAVSVSATQHKSLTAVSSIGILNGAVNRSKIRMKIGLHPLPISSSQNLGASKLPQLAQKQEPNQNDDVLTN